MKIRRVLPFFVVICYTFWFACESRKERVTSPPPESVTAVITTGENVFRSLSTELIHSLQQAIRDHGAAGAIEFCNIEALPLTQKISNTHSRVTAVKRTSYLYRNRKNRPDKYEKIALDYFLKYIDSGLPIPSYYVQSIEKRGEKFYRYYKPLSVMPMCLSCHGNPEDLSPDVRAELKEKYPKDKALGYSVNDFRGVVSISIADQ